MLAGCGRGVIIKHQRKIPGDRRKVDDYLVFSFLAAEQLLRTGRFGTFPLSNSACAIKTNQGIAPSKVEELGYSEKVCLNQLPCFFFGGGLSC